MDRFSWSLGVFKLGKVLTGLAAILRGDINPVQAAREVVRRGRLTIRQRSERSSVARQAETNLSDLLIPEFQRLSPEALLSHFRERQSPTFFPGFQSAQSTVSLQQKLFPAETEELIRTANSIIEHRWPLLGFGEIAFGESLDWRRDPLSGRVWPLAYHADVSLLSLDGSDVRVLWELNRLGHFITLGRALVVTGDERFAQEICAQLDSWLRANPVGQGPNWSCAMEVALRAMNLLATLALCRLSKTLTGERLAVLLGMLAAHGSHIKRNLEFSYLGNSNHYLTDVVGLLWLGIMLPELTAAADWRRWALREMVREMKNQVLPDGADYEGSTGYHRYATELFLYSFLLCRENKVDIDDRYRQKLETMLSYLRAYRRPDGFAPLVGDTDGGQVLPITLRRADDHGYLLAIGAAVLGKSDFNVSEHGVSEEMLWLLGEQGIAQYENLAANPDAIASQGFVDAGIYLLRNDDDYLLFNAARNHRSGCASHRHNDALSIEVATGGRRFIVDPGTYVYSADLKERQLFRSTEFHSTVMIDSVEQNTIERSQPFVIGSEARPHLIAWQPGSDRDFVSAEHYGYRRLREPVTHRRSITFHKSDGWWLIEDEFAGRGEHAIATYFHFDAGLEITSGEGGIVSALDRTSGTRLLVCPLDSTQNPESLNQSTSVHYGLKSRSLTSCWKSKAQVPLKLRWAIVPVLVDEDLAQRLSLVRR